MGFAKDKLEDMDISLIKDNVFFTIFSGLVYSQTTGHTSHSWVRNGRSGYCLFNDTSQYNMGLMVW